jgi:signal transduction histidine kinase
MNYHIPNPERRAMLQRLLIVWGFAFLIGLGLWSSKGFAQNFWYQMVYSYAISTWIWFFTDVVGYMLFCKADQRWPQGWVRHVFITSSIVVGYGLGTAIGDWFAGVSTWELIALDRSRFIGIAIMTLAISVGFISFFYQREKSIIAQRQASEARLVLLQSQLEPHMLFNTLANLRALIATDPQRATHMLDSLNNYLRSTLQASRATLHPLSAEFDRVKDYLELMSIRMEPRLAYTLRLPPELAAHPVPPLLLQPLVENAIKHGLEPTVAGGAVTVTASAAGGVLRLEVRDTGGGMQSPTTETTRNTSAKGFGLAQVRERLHSVYGNAAALELIASHAGFTRAIVTFPFQKVV